MWLLSSCGLMERILKPLVFLKKTPKTPFLAQTWPHSLCSEQTHYSSLSSLKMNSEFSTVHYTVFQNMLLNLSVLFWRPWNRSTGTLLLNRASTFLKLLWVFRHNSKKLFHNLRWKFENAFISVAPAKIRRSENIASTQSPRKTKQSFYSGLREKKKLR